MTSLLDIGPLTEEVSVGKKKVTVLGITAEGFFRLLSTFPEVKKLMEKKSVDAKVLMSVAPGSIATVIALATTPRPYPAITGDDEKDDRGEERCAAKWTRELDRAKLVALQLPVGVQLSIIGAAIRLTFPEGVGPFVKELNVLTSSVRGVSGQAQDTTSSKKSRSGFTTDSPSMRLGQGAPHGSSAH